MATVTSTSDIVKPQYAAIEMEDMEDGTCEGDPGATDGQTRTRHTGGSGKVGRKRLLVSQITLFFVCYRVLFKFKDIVFFI